jgi:hypothetical protein
MWISIGHSFFKLSNVNLKTYLTADLVIVLKLSQRVLFNLDLEAFANSEAILQDLAN